MTGFNLAVTCDGMETQEIDWIRIWGIWSPQAPCHVSLAIPECFLQRCVEHCPAFRATAIGECMLLPQVLVGLQLSFPSRTLDCNKISMPFTCEWF